MEKDDLESLLFRLFERQVCGDCYASFWCLFLKSRTRVSWCSLISLQQSSEKQSETHANSCVTSVQSRWNFIQLQKETDQPAVWLKEVLGEVAVLNKRGAHANLWELKKEYRAAGGSNDVEMQDA